MTTIGRYARERLRPGQVLPAVALVAGAAQAADGWRGGIAAAADAAIAAALVVTFRIWDDLADRAADAVAHPDRISTRPEAVRALGVCAAAMGLAAAAIVWLRHGILSVGLLAALTGTLASWYERRGGRSAGGDHLRLLKYPVFAALLCGVRPLTSVRGALSIVTAYLGASVYEWWHDPLSPVRYRARVVEAMLLVSATLTLARLLEGVR